MDYSFADRISSLQPSVIREILKFSSVPGMISFAAGNPAPEAFPTEQLAKISAEIYKERPIDALQYSVTEGYTPLRNALKSRYSYLLGGGDELIITSGAQQVMHLATKSLCNEGDVIICEKPSFIGSLNAFRSFNAKLVGVELERDGMNIEMLEAALKENPNAKFIYVIPNFQNPAGICTSLEKRKAIYQLAKQYGVMILEDNPYGDTRFEGEEIPSIKSFDEDGIVIYAGSFSKVISPGLRVGYAIAPAPVIAKMTVCKQISDVHTSIYSQLLVHEFLTGGQFEQHLLSIKEIYRKKCGLMCSLFEEKLSPYVTFEKPQGGLFIWCTLPDGIDMMSFCKAAVERNVAVVPGSAFLTDESQPCNSFRTNFSTPTDEQIVNGVDILSKLLSEIAK
ncbi:MAG: PLP-dependent aminotransferase family protein [Oscillospiraceae bacterium]|nr:PLP-dependent aminotransferase family protein [Oscillospiraceae bacterium]